MQVTINNATIELNAKTIGFLICDLMKNETFVQGCKEFKEEEVGEVVIAAVVLSSAVAN